MNDLNNLVENFAKTPVLLVGDIMLDTFVYGDVSRISPEAPIPVLSVSREDKMLGGAGNVLANLAALGCDSTIIAVTGDDMAGHEIAQIVEDLNCPADGLVRDENRPTILKSRYLSQNQQLLRVDCEKAEPLAPKIESEILTKVKEIIGSMKLLVLSDYGKGTLTPDLIKELVKLAKKNKIPVIVDPKANDYSVYKGASIVTPNKKELAAATGGMPVSTDEEVENAARFIIKKSGIDTVIATRSEDGISVISKNQKPVHLKTKALEVYDVSGAGDTVVAALAATIASGGPLEDAAHIANIAGGLVVSKVGTAVVRGDEIMQAANMPEISAGNIAPVLDWDGAKEQIRKWQTQGSKVGFTNGCFDILHYGHVNYLAQAREKCDRLVLGLNHDASVKILKGANRPINDQMARATVMAALASVDLVVFFGAEKEGEDNTPCEIVGHLKPDILMKGGDYTVDQLPEAQVALSYGGQVEIMPLYEGYSTTNIIAKSKTEAA